MFRHGGSARCCICLETKGELHICQTKITVDEHDTVVGLGQRVGEVGGDCGLANAALTARDSDGFQWVCASQKVAIWYPASVLSARVLQTKLGLEKMMAQVFGPLLGLVGLVLRSGC